MLERGFSSTVNLHTESTHSQHRLHSVSKFRDPKEAMGSFGSRNVNQALTAYLRYLSLDFPIIAYPGGYNNYKGIEKSFLEISLHVLFWT